MKRLLLKNKISYYELSTPLSTRDMAHYNYGELYETNELDDKDYYQKYCSNKYKRFFENN